MKPNTEIISVTGNTVTLQRMHQDVGCGQLIMGDDVKIGYGVVIDLTGDVSLADLVEIQDYVNIWTHKHHWRHSRGLRKDIQKVTSHSLVVGTDAFIGTRAMLIGVESIGDGAIIGAGAVVQNREVLPFEIWKGNPAVFQGYRKAI